MLNMKNKKKGTKNNDKNKFIIEENDIAYVPEDEEIEEIGFSTEELPGKTIKTFSMS